MGITEDIRRLLESDPRPKAEIARLAGIPEPAISNFRQSKKSFSAESLEKIADVLGYAVIVKRKPRK